MKVQKNGTDVWCPACQAFTTCAAIPAENVDGDTSLRGQRRTMKEYPDLSFFLRGRECRKCLHTFLTAEIDLDILDELMRLRTSVSEATKTAEAASTHGKALVQAVEKLRSSLPKVQKSRRETTDG